MYIVRYPHASKKLVQRSFTATVADNAIVHYATLPLAGHITHCTLSVRPSISRKLKVVQRVYITLQSAMPFRPKGQRSRSPRFTMLKHEMYTLRWLSNVWPFDQNWWKYCHPKSATEWGFTKLKCQRSRLCGHYIDVSQYVAVVYAYTLYKHVSSNLDHSFTGNSRHHNIHFEIKSLKVKLNESNKTHNRNASNRRM